VAVTVTVLFCDVTGSTALGESTDPEALIPIARETRATSREPRGRETLPHV
jgi:class 3 adenylate cyclase